MKLKLVANPLKTQSQKFDNYIKNKSFNSNLFVIRHAESQFNKAIHDLEKTKDSFSQEDYQYQKLQIRFNQELCDCPITNTGKDQCYEAGKLLNRAGVNFKYVFVSPMKRTLMTLECLLDGVNKNSSQQTKPQVVVHPLLFEKIEDSCDLIKDVNLNMKEHSFHDWTHFHNLEHLPLFQLKYCDNVINNNISKSYHQQAIESFVHSKLYEHHKIVLPAMRELSRENKFIESSKQTLERLITFKQFVDTFRINNNVKQDENILVIGHSVLFKHLTSKLICERSSEPDGAEIVLKNCEIVNIS